MNISSLYLKTHEISVFFPLKKTYGNKLSIMGGPTMERE